ncbi:MAG: hypothetical protein QM844_04630, partial [Planctomycetota bacterium]|nr:hypothetical protein [Planctomycetota bacterium]
TLGFAVKRLRRKEDPASSIRPEATASVPRPETPEQNQETERIADRWIFYHPRPTARDSHPGKSVSPKNRSLRGPAPRGAPALRHNPYVTKRGQSARGYLNSSGFFHESRRSI